MPNKSTNYYVMSNGKKSDIPMEQFSEYARTNPDAYICMVDEYKNRYDVPVRQFDEAQNKDKLRPFTIDASPAQPKQGRVAAAQKRGVPVSQWSTRQESKEQGAYNRQMENEPFSLTSIFNPDGTINYNNVNAGAENFVDSMPDRVDAAARDVERRKVRQQEDARLRSQYFNIPKTNNAVEKPVQPSTPQMTNTGNWGVETESTPQMTDTGNWGIPEYAREQGEFNRRTPSPRPMFNADGTINYGNINAEAENFVNSMPDRVNAAAEDVERRKKNIDNKSPQRIQEDYEAMFNETEEGKRLTHNLQVQQDDLIAEYQQEFPNDEGYQNIMADYRARKISEDEANKQLDARFNELYGKQLDKDLQPSIDEYNTAFNQRYGKELEGHLVGANARVQAQEAANSQKEIDEEYHRLQGIYSKEDGSMAYMQSPSAMGISVAPRHPDLERLGYATELNNEALDIQRAAANGEGFGEGLINSIKDIDTWSMGITDLAKGLDTYAIVAKANRNEKLTKDEQLYLDSVLRNMAVSAYYGKLVGTGYKAGQTTGTSIPLMLEFIANPISGSGNALAKGILKYGMKRFGLKLGARTAEKAGKKLAAGLMRVGARTVGNAAAAAGMTGTSSLGKVAAGTLERMNGQLGYDIDGKGNMSYNASKTEGAQDFLPALGKSAYSTWVDNFTEMFFSAFTRFKGRPMGFGGKAAAEVPKNLRGKIAEALSSVKKFTPLNIRNALYKKVPELKDVMDRAQIGGFGVENAEEWAGNILEIPVGEQTWEDTTSLDTNLDIFFGILPTQVAFAAIGLGGWAHASHKYDAAKNKLLSTMSEGQRLQFAEMERNAENGDVPTRNYLKEVLFDKTFSAEEKKKEIMALYYSEMERLARGYEEADAMSADEIAQRKRAVGTAENSEDTMPAPQDELAYDEDDTTPEAIARGNAIYASGDGSSMRGAVLAEEAARRKLNEYCDDETIADFVQMDDGQRAVALGELEGSAQAALADYLDKYDQLQGVKQAMEAAHAEEQQAATDAVERMPKNADNEVAVVPLGKYGDEQHRYGVVVKGMNTDGTFGDAGVTVVPIEDDGNGGYLLDTYDEANAVVMAVEPDAAPVYLHADDVREGMLTAYKEDLANLEDAPIEAGQQFEVAEGGESAPVTVIGQDEAGNWLVQFEGEEQPASLSEDYLVEAKHEAELLQQDRAAATPAAETTVDETGVPVQEEVVSEMETPTDQSAEEVETPTIPTNSRGQMQFHFAAPETTLDYIQNQGLDNDEMSAFVSANIVSAKKELSNSDKRKPKIGTDIAAYKQQKATWEAENTDLRARVAYWQDIQSRMAAPAQTTNNVNNEKQHTEGNTGVAGSAAANIPASGTNVAADVATGKTTVNAGDTGARTVQTGARGNSHGNGGNGQGTSSVVAEENSQNISGGQTAEAKPKVTSYKNGSMQVLDNAADQMLDAYASAEDNRATAEELGQIVADSKVDIAKEISEREQGIAKIRQQLADVQARHEKEVVAIRERNKALYEAQGKPIQAKINEMLGNPKSKEEAQAAYAKLSETDKASVNELARQRDALPYEKERHLAIGLANGMIELQEKAVAKLREIQQIKEKNAEAKKKQKAAQEEAERIKREALNGVPDMVDDKPKDARARGYRRVNGHKVDRQQPLQPLQGKAISVKFSNDTIVNGSVAVIDAGQLQPSHVGGMRNPLHFIDEAQPKERNDEASVLSAQKMAANIRPEEITSSVTAYTGAPTVNARGEAIQGNSRSDALRQMWDSHKEQAQQYKQYLKDHAEEFGLRAEDIEAMEHPVLVNMVDVADDEAVKLGQYVASDTESGGTERIKPKNAVQKLGSNIRSFANILLKSTDDETSFAGLVDANGVEVLKWMNQRGFITNTQYSSAFDSKGNITAEAKNDLKGILFQSIFTGGSTRLEEMFNAMPAKVQRAILATAYRDFDSKSSERMVGEIQNSIRAFYALSSDAQFVAAKTFKDARIAAEAWKRQYQMDDVTGESYLPSENFTNFALHLATMYKGESQTFIQSTFNRMFDLIQGVQEESLFEQTDNTPRTLAQAINEVLNIEYDGQQRSNVLVGDTTTSQQGEQGSDGNAAAGERVEDGNQPADNPAGAESGGGQGEVNNVQQPVRNSGSGIGDVRFNEQIDRVNTRLDFLRAREAAASSPAKRKELTAEKTAILQAYVDTFKTTATVVVSVEDAAGLMERNGVSQKLINKFLTAVADGEKINGFFVHGTVYLIAENAEDADAIRNTYVHERQHVLTSEELIKRVLDVATTDELKGFLRKQTDSLFYEKKDADVLANEFISFAMQEIYDGITAAELTDNVALQQLLNDIDNEQRKNNALSKSRRNAPVNNNTEGSSRQGRRNQGGKPGDVGGQGLRPNPRGAAATESGGVTDNVQQTSNGRGGLSDEAAQPVGVRASGTEVQDGGTTARPATGTNAAQRNGRAGTAERGEKDSVQGNAAREGEVGGAEVGKMPSPQPQINAGYTVEAAQYTTKRGKVLDMQLVKFDKELTKEEQRAAKELAKSLRGWYDREKGGFMMRSDADARQMVDAVMEESGETLADAAPLSLQDVKKAAKTESETPTKRNDEAEKPAKEEPKKNEGALGLVSDERMAELKERLRKKLGGQLNVGIDPETFALGMELAVGHIDRGVKKFADFVKVMIADFGDVIRPYLKEFYMAATTDDRLSDAVIDEMDDAKTVRSFNVATFGKEYADPLSTANTVVAEQKVHEQTEETKKQLINKRNTERKKEDEQTTADTEAIAGKAEAIASEAEDSAGSLKTEREATGQVAKIDNAIDEVNDQLALLGYYEATPNGGYYSKDYNEASGFQKAAEKRALEDVNALVGKIAQHLGISPKGIKASANIAPIGGDITVYIPLTDGKSLYIDILLSSTGEDDLKIDNVYFRTKNVIGVDKKGRKQYDNGGSNNFCRADVTVGELLREIDKEIAFSVPEFGGNVETEEAQPVSVEETTPAVEETAQTDGRPKEWADLKVGDKVLYKGKESTIYDFEDYGEHCPVLDTGLAPVLYDRAQWSDIKRVEPAAKKTEEKGKKENNGTENSVSSQQQIGDLFGDLSEVEPVKEETPLSDNVRRNFADAVASDMLQALGNDTKPYRSIVDLRKRAKSVGMEVDEDGRTDILLQELVEDGLVRAAKKVIEKRGRSSREAFDEICKLYEMQPTIAARSSNRIKMQQYSTPLPMSWAADFFAMDGQQDGTVLEPTAGNGMLVFAIPSSQVHVNELDDTRLSNLREQGFAKVTQQDATEPFGGATEYDAVIANPPFGHVAAKEYDGKKIDGLDPQIALNALAKMKDGGRAAIIIGGNMEYGSNGAIKSMKAFFTYLYDHYNVKGVVDMDGKLYAKQGTTYPTRMILIDGRRSEEERAQTAVYPPVESKAVPKVSTFEELYNTVNDIINNKEKTNGTEILRSKQGQLVSVRNEPSGETDGGRHRGEHHTDDANGRGKRGKTESVSDTAEGSPVVLRGERGKNIGNGEARSGTNGDGENGTGRGNTGRIVQGLDAVGVPENGVGLDQTQEKPKEKRSLTEEKLPYIPHNTAFSLNSVAPAAMVEAMNRVLSQIESKCGSVDEFVTKELGYDSVEEAHQALAAEQMDSVAMAIYQMIQGQALVIGDQTGVGKGRQMAALIRWAVKQGKKPVFITQKADLFSDIYRDLVDVGSGDLVPFIFNSDGAMVDANGNAVHKPMSANEQKKVFDSGKIPDGYDFAILTYSQVNTGDAQSQTEADASNKSGTRIKKNKASKDGRATPKATFLRGIAKDNYLFFDESHTAAGSSNTGVYLQSILKDAKAVTFASATFAKRPDTMPIYAIRTAISKAKVAAEDMIGIIERGGVTLQEIMSRALTQAGQMVRRERDMSDVKTDWKTIDDPKTVQCSRENYDRTIAAFNAIIKFQEDFVKPKIQALSDDLATTASSADIKRGTDKMGVANVSFASKTYNYTKQLMLALKVDAIADEVVREIEAGRHPVIALESTMEASIKEYSVGDVISEPTFSASLLKGLDTVMQYTVKDEDGNAVNYRYRPEDLGKAGESAYYELQDFIREATSEIFISPLDAIIDKLHEKGLKVGELTGRNLYVEKNDNGEVVVKRRTDKDKKRMQREFNNGNLDVLILNKSASTGISLHASQTFGDQRQRSMIIAQPLSDINDYMQMIGRIDRTGQVHRGYYINLGLPVPAENRFLMMLSTKLKSLNANTTTSQDSESNEVAAPDLLNKYGSQVVVEYLRDNPEIYDKMGTPLKKGTGVVQASELDEYKPQEDDARRVTGYVALLSTQEQDEFYDDVVRRYNELIKYLNDTGNNDLKITVMPLRAKTLERKVASTGMNPKSDNPFAQNSYVEKIEMDVLKKPMTAADIKKTIEHLNGADAKARLQSIIATIEAEEQAKQDAETARYEKAKARAAEDIAKITSKINDSKKLTDEQKKDAIASSTERINEAVEEKHKIASRRISENADQLKSRLKWFTVGHTYPVPDNLEAQTYVFSSPAIFCGYKAKDSNITASTTLAVFATLDGRVRVEVKMNQLNALSNITSATNENWEALHSITLENWDSQIPTESRKVGYVMTGNILQAIADTEDETGAYVGRLISYTDMDGNVHDGILMPDKWDASRLKSSGAPLISRLSQIKNYEPVVSRDGKVEILGSQWTGRFTLTVPKTKKDGGVFFTNNNILNAINNNNFYPYRGKLRADISEEHIDAVVRELSKLGVQVKEENNGLDEESDGEDIHFQVVGKKGAAALDKAEEATTRLDNLNVAREMETSKKDAKTIKLATGWERGADGKWRYEIDDIADIDLKHNVAYDRRHPEHKRYRDLMRKQTMSAFNLGEELTDDERKELDDLKIVYGGNRESNNSHKLKDYVDAPELFKAYPQLEDVDVLFGETILENAAAEYLPTQNKIVIADKNVGKDKSYIKSLFIHEIQHAIQDIEGFAKGGNTKDAKFQEAYKKKQLKFINDSLEKYEDRIKVFSDKLDKLNSDKTAWTPERMEESSKQDDELRKKIDAIYNEPNYVTLKKAQNYWFDKSDLSSTGGIAYARLAGEVEARNVQQRMGMTYEQRLNSLLSETEDVAREDQISITDGLTSGAQAQAAQEDEESGEDILFSVTAKQDADYLDAVKRGDMETAQKMVDEAAEKAFANSNVRGTDGKLIKMYHFSPNKFTVFDREKILKRDDIDGFWFSEKPLHSYGNYGGSFYINSNAKEINPDEDIYFGNNKGKYKGMDVWIHGIRHDRTLDKSRGKLIPAYKYCSTLIVQNPNSIKSADAVTYDDEGNVIPLSERFNEEKEDIRFSVTGNNNSEENTGAPQEGEDALPERPVKKAGEKFSDYMARVNEWRSAMLRAGDVDMEREETLRTETGMLNEMDKLREKAKNYDTQRRTETAQANTIERLRKRLAERRNKEYSVKNLLAQIAKLRTKIDNTRENLTDNVQEIRILIARGLTPDAASYLGKRGITDLLGEVNTAAAAAIANGDRAKLRERMDEVMAKVERVVNDANQRSVMADLALALHIKVKDVNGRGVSVAANVYDSSRKIIEQIRGTFADLIRTELDGTLKQARAALAEANKALEANKGDEAAAKAAEEARAEVERIKSEIDSLKADKAVDERAYIKKRTEELDKKISDHAAGQGVITPEELQEYDALPVREKVCQVRDIEMEMNEADRRATLLDVERRKLRKERATATPERKEEIKELLKQNAAAIKSAEADRASAQRELIATAAAATEMINEIIDTGRTKLQNYRASQRERRGKVVRMAVGAFRHKPIKGMQDYKSRWEKFKDWFTGGGNPFTVTLDSFNFLLKYFDYNHPIGEGELYKHFMKGKEGAMAAADQLFEGIEEFGKKMDEKCQEIFGMSFADISAKSKTEKRDIPVMRMEGGRNPYNLTAPEGEMQDVRMEKGDALYVYMLWQMDDGQAKLRAQGITDESMAIIEDFIGKEYMDFAKFVQDEYLPDLRARKYNPKHIELYGTSMADTEHYFPFKISKAEIGEKTELGEDVIGMPSAAVGAVRNRVNHSLSLDTKNNAFAVLAGNVKEMEQFTAYGTLITDLNALLSSSYVKALLDANGRGNFKRFRMAATLATQSFHENNTEFDDTVARLNKLLAGGAISFRLNTAAKQILSLPAFLEYSSDPAYLKQLLLNVSPVGAGVDVMRRNWVANFKWCIENLPSFRERVGKGTSGNINLEEQTFGWIDKFQTTGMIPNKIVDAFTISVGAKSIYDYAVAKYKKAGCTEEEADRLAKMDAEVAFNETQQSSHAAFVSEIQKSHNFFKRTLMTFQTSNVGYYRKFVEGIAAFTRDNMAVAANLKKEYMANGMSDEEAGKAAWAHIWRTKGHGAKNILLNGYVMNTLWKLGGFGFIGLTAGMLGGSGGDDDWWTEEEKRQVLIAAVTAPFMGTAGLGNFAMNAAEKHAYNPNMLFSELENSVSGYTNASKNGLFSKGVAIYAMQQVPKFAGVNPETYVNAYLGAESIIKKGGSTDAVDVMLMMNTPASERKKMAERMMQDKGIIEYAKAVEAAYKYYPASDWHSYLPTTKELSGKKEKEIEKKYWTGETNSEKLNERFNNILNDTRNPAEKNLQGKDIMRKEVMKNFAEENGNPSAANGIAASTENEEFLKEMNADDARRDFILRKLVKLNKDKAEAAKGNSLFYAHFINEYKDALPAIERAKETKKQIDSLKKKLTGADEETRRDLMQQIRAAYKPMDNDWQLIKEHPVYGQ